MATAELWPAILKTFSNKVLPKEETRELIYQAQRGSRAAKDRIVRHNMRMVYMVAKRYTYALPLEDLMQEGVMGLLKAVEDFKLETNNCLSTYAQWWIAAYCKRAAQKCTGMPAINKAGPTRHLVHSHADEFVSLDNPVPNSDATFVDILPGNDLPQDEVIHRRQMGAAIRREVIWTSKDGREAAVARRIADRKDRDYELGRLGAIFGVSRERIRQIEMRMRLKLASNRKLKKLAGEA